MNTTLKSSTLVPLNNAADSDSFQSQKSLMLIQTDKPDRPNQQQKQAIAQIYVEQAWLYFKERNWQEAIAACKNALHLDTRNTDAYKIFGNILNLKGKKAEALGIYAKALEINPDSAAIYANLGSFHAEQKNWQQALDYYQQAVIIDPSLAGAYRNLAQVWEELGDNKQALECLCQAVNLEPDKLSAAEYFDFGERLYREGKLKEASIFYIHGVELAPQAETQLARLVKILEELEEWQQAVIFYHKLISISNGEDSSATGSSNKPIRNLLSKAKAKTKTKVVRQKTIAAATEQTPQLVSKLEIQPGRADSAAKRPDSAVSWNNLGSSYAQKQQWVKAISCYKEAIELNPDLSKTYRNLARVYSKIGKQERAALCWYEAFDREPNCAKPEEHLRLAQNLLALKQVAKAIVCLHHAVKLDANFSQAYLLLGKLSASQGKAAEAKAYYDKANRDRIETKVEGEEISHN